VRPFKITDAAATVQRDGSWVCCWKQRVSVTGCEWMPVDCFTHVVRRWQKISRQTSFWSVGPLVWLLTTTI